MNLNHCLPQVVSLCEFFDSFNFNEYFRKFFEDEHNLLNATYAFTTFTDTPISGSMRFNVTSTEKRLSICRYDELQCDEINIFNSTGLAPMDFSRLYVNVKADGGMMTATNNEGIAHWQKSFMSYINARFQRKIDTVIENELGHLLCVRYKVSKDKVKDIQKCFSIVPKNPRYTEYADGWCMPRNSLIRKLRFTGQDGNRKINGGFIPYISVCTEFDIIMKIPESEQKF